QYERDVGAAIDANETTGWAIDHGGKPHVAVFELAEPVAATDGTALRVTLEFKADARYQLGRFRLSVSSDPPTIEWERKRLAALKLTDPWLRLAAAYGLNGRNDKAAEYFARALQGANGRAGKATVIAAAAPLPGHLEKLAESAPNDGPFQAELAR